MPEQHLHKMKKLIRQLADPRILTLDEALGKNLPNFPDETKRRQAASKTILAIIDRIATRFSTEEEFEGLTAGEKLVYELFFFSGEISNSGFHTFLGETHNEGITRTKDYLKRVGAEECFVVLEELANRFKVESVGTGKFEAGTNQFESQDKWFGEYAPHLDQLLIKFVNDNRRDFMEPFDNIVKELRKSELIRKHYGLKNALEPDYVDRSLQAIDREIDALGENTTSHKKDCIEQ